MPFCRGVYLCIDYCNYCSAAQNNLTIIALGHNGAHVLIILTSRMTLDIRFAVHCPGPWLLLYYALQGVSCVLVWCLCCRINADIKFIEHKNGTTLFV